jgi:CHAT domain-containing protein
MVSRPRTVPWRRSLAAFCLAASLILPGASAARAALPGDQIRSAAGLFFEGRASSARQALVRLLQGAALEGPSERARALETLLDICIHSAAAACVVEYGPKYAEAAGAVPTTDDAQKQVLAWKAAYYLDYARFASGSEQAMAQVLESDLWKRENAFLADTYIRRQLLAANILVTLDRRVEAVRTLDRLLSLVASLKNPQENRFVVAWALSDAIALLAGLGETERAYGAYRSSGDFIAAALPASTIDGASFRLVEGQLLQQMGGLKLAGKPLDEALATFRRVELDDDVKTLLVGNTLTLKAVGCAAQGQLDCALEAIQSHPSSRLYGRRGRVPASYEEVAYLAARALVGALEGKPDQIAAEALQAPQGFHVIAGAQPMLAVYRAAGAALALPPDATRQQALVETGRLMVAAARTPPASFGAWYRPDPIDQILLGLGLSQAGNAGMDDDTAFALFQLDGRRGASFDADALTMLGEAKDDLQRRSAHQALRLRARRDRFERVELQAMSRRASQPATGSLLTHDSATRLTFRDFAVHMDRAAEAIGAGRAAAGAANLVPLARLQAVLGPDEAALSVAPATGGGFAYICVRRDSVTRKVAAADEARLRLDIRLLQSALTAGHAPSERLDAQFPVEAAVRLYDVLIRPFENCLKPGDQIVWLPGVAMTGFPLAALLPAPPPRTNDGWDLARADWLVRRHAVSYAGSASMIVSARSGARTAASDFDFLGVGDPVLSGATASGEDREKILLRGVRSGSELATLSPLPETRDELEQSARGFGRAKVLMASDATEKAFRSQLVGSYRFLSFATHGLLRDDLQGLAEPALALTPVSGDDLSNDGLLTASEIADLNLGARFVALSACNTASFDLAQMSAELPALASAFAVAGVPSTLATLWAVDSETSKQVVASIFGRLGASGQTGAAEALAQAQRAFLAAPPGRAYLHPRFWAPFVLLGDGGKPAAASPAPTGPNVVAVELLTEGGGGEVMAVGRAQGRPAARFVGDPGPSGRHAGGAWAAGAGRIPAWRHDDPGVGAVGFLVELGPRLIAGGYRQGSGGRTVPTLETFDTARGTRAEAWRGADMPDLDAFVVGGAKLGPAEALLLVAGRDLKDGAASSRFAAFRIDAAAAPRPFFEVELPKGADVDTAAAVRQGDALIVAYTDRFAPVAARPYLNDDYDQTLCGAEPFTWIEVRDAGAGTLRASKLMRGLVITSATTAPDGRILLAGSLQQGCAAEARAVVISVDAQLALSPVFLDASLGASEVRALAPAGAKVLVVASKDKVTDFMRRGGNATPGAYAMGDLRSQKTGMLLSLGPGGAASAPRMLDSGFDLFLSAADASDPGDILLGGSLGGQAAVFHLSGPP